MPSNEAAIWSAIAASFAALSSFLIYRTSLRNLRLTARPDIILEKWSRVSEDTGNEKIRFSEIGNIGNGTAQHIYINSFATTEDDRPTYSMSTSRVPVLAKDANIPVNNEIHICWKNVPEAKNGSKHLSINIKILYWDTIGIRHAKQYRLFVLEDRNGLIATGSIAPGISLGPLITNSTPVWRLKLYRKLAPLPYIGEWFKDNDV